MADMSPASDFSPADTSAARPAAPGVRTATANTCASPHASGGGPSFPPNMPPAAAADKSPAATSTATEGSPAAESPAAVSRAAMSAASESPPATPAAAAGSSGTMPAAAAESPAASPAAAGDPAAGRPAPSVGVPAVTPAAAKRSSAATVVGAGESLAAKTAVAPAGTGGAHPVSPSSSRAAAPPAAAAGFSGVTSSADGAPAAAVAAGVSAARGAAAAGAIGRASQGGEAVSVSSAAGRTQAGTGTRPAAAATAAAPPVRGRQGEGSGGRAAVEGRRGGERGGVEGVAGGMGLGAAAEGRRPRQRGGGVGGGTGFPLFEDAAAVVTTAPRLPAIAGIICLVNTFFCLTLLCLYMLLEDYGESSVDWQEVTAGSTAAHTAAEALLHGAATAFEGDAPPKLVPSVLFVSNPFSSNEVVPSLYYCPPAAAAGLPTPGRRLAAGQSDASVAAATKQLPRAAELHEAATREKPGATARAAAVASGKRGYRHGPLPASNTTGRSKNSLSPSGNSRRGGEPQDGRSRSSLPAAGEEENDADADGEGALPRSSRAAGATGGGVEGQGNRGDGAVERGKGAWKTSQQSSSGGERSLARSSSRSSSNASRQGRRSTAAADSERKKTAATEEQEHKSAGWIRWWPSFSLAWLFQRAEELPLSHAVLRRVDSLRLHALRLQQQLRRGGQDRQGEDAAVVEDDDADVEEQQQREEEYATQKTLLRHLKERQRLLREEDVARFLDFTLSHIVLSSLLSSYGKLVGSGYSRHLDPSDDRAWSDVLYGSSAGDGSSSRHGSSSDSTSSDSSSSAVVRRESRSNEATTTRGAQQQPAARATREAVVGAALLQELARYLYIANPAVFAPPCARRGPHGSVQLLRCSSSSDSAVASTTSPHSTKGSRGCSPAAVSNSSGSGLTNTPTSASCSVSGAALENASVPVLLRVPKRGGGAATGAGTEGGEDEGREGRQLQSSGSVYAEYLLDKRRWQQCVDVPSLLGDSSLVRRLLVRSAAAAALPSAVPANWDHVLQLLPLYDLREMPLTPPPHRLQQILSLPAPPALSRTEPLHTQQERLQQAGGGGASQQREGQSEEEEEEEAEEGQEVEGEHNVNTRQVLSSEEDVVVETVIDSRANYLYVFVLYRRDPVYMHHTGEAAAAEPEPSALWVQHTVPGAAAARAAADTPPAASRERAPPGESGAADRLSAKASASQREAGGGGEEAARRRAADEAGRAESVTAAAKEEVVRYRTRLVVYRRSLVDLVQAALVAKPSRTTLMQLVENLVSHATQKDLPRQQQERGSSSSMWQQLYYGGGDSVLLSGAPGWLFGSGGRDRPGGHQQQHLPSTARRGKRATATAAEVKNAAAVAALLEAMRIGGEPALDSLRGASLAPVLRELLQHQQRKAEQQVPQQQQDFHQEQETKQQRQREPEAHTTLHGERHYRERLAATVGRDWARRWRIVGRRSAAASAVRLRIGRYMAPGSFFVLAAPVPLPAASAAARRVAGGTTQTTSGAASAEQQQEQFYRVPREEQQILGQGQQEVRTGTRRRTVGDDAEGDRTTETASKLSTPENQAEEKWDPTPASSLYYVDTSSAAFPAAYDVRVLSLLNRKQQQGMPSLWEARAAVRLSALHALDGMDRMAIATALAAGGGSTDAPQQQQDESTGKKKQHREKAGVTDVAPASLLYSPAAQLPAQPFAVPFRFAREAFGLTVRQHSCRIHTPHTSGTPAAAGAPAAAAGAFVAAAEGWPATESRLGKHHHQQRCGIAGGGPAAACEADAEVVDFQQPVPFEQHERQPCPEGLVSAPGGCIGGGFSSSSTAATGASPDARAPGSLADTGAASAAGERYAAEEEREGAGRRAAANEGGVSVRPREAEADLAGSGRSGAASWLRPQLYLPDSLYLVLEYRREARDAYNALVERRGSLLTAAVRLPIAVASAGGQLLLSYAEFLYLLLGETGRCSSSLFFILKACIRSPYACYQRMQQERQPLPKHPWIDLRPLYRRLHGYYSKGKEQEQHSPAASQHETTKTSRQGQHQSSELFQQQLHVEPQGRQDETAEEATPLTPWALLQLAVSLSMDAALVLWDQQQLFVGKTFGILLGTEKDMEEKLFYFPPSTFTLNGTSSHNTRGSNSSWRGAADGEEQAEEAAHYSSSSLPTSSGESQRAIAGGELRGLKVNYARALVMSQRTFERAAAAAAAAAAGYRMAAAEAEGEDNDQEFVRKKKVAPPQRTVRGDGEAARRAVEAGVWEFHLELFEQERQQREEQEARTAEARVLPWTRVRSAENTNSSAATAAAAEGQQAEQTEEEEYSEEGEGDDWVAATDDETQAELAAAAAAEGQTPTDAAADVGSAAGGRRGRQHSAGRHVLGVDGEASAAQQLRRKQQAHVHSRRRRTAASRSKGGVAAAAAARGAHAASPPFENAWEELLALLHGGLQRLCSSTAAAPAVYLSQKLQQLLFLGEGRSEEDDTRSATSDGAGEQEKQHGSEDLDTSGSSSSVRERSSSDGQGRTGIDPHLRAADEVPAARQWEHQEQQKQQGENKGGGPTIDVADTTEKESMALHTAATAARETGAAAGETEAAAGKTGPRAGETGAAAGVPALLWALTEGVSPAALGAALRGFQLVRSYAIEGDQAWLAVDRSSLSAAVVYSQRKNLDTQWRVTLFPRVDRTADRVLAQRRQHLYRQILQQQLREGEPHQQQQFRDHQEQERRGNLDEDGRDAGVPATQSSVRTPHSGVQTRQFSTSEHTLQADAPALDPGVRTPHDVQGVQAWQTFSGVRTPQLLEGIDTLPWLSGGGMSQELTAPISTALTLTVGAPPVIEEEAEEEDETKVFAGSAAAESKKQKQQPTEHAHSPGAAAAAPEENYSGDLHRGARRNGSKNTSATSNLSHDGTAAADDTEEDSEQQEGSTSAAAEYELLTLKFEGSAAVETGALSSDGLIFRRAQDAHVFRQSLPLAALLRYHQQQLQRQRPQQQLQQHGEETEEASDGRKGASSRRERRGGGRAAAAEEEAGAVPLLPDYVGPRMDSGVQGSSASSRRRQEQQLRGDVLLLQTIRGSSSAAAAASTSSSRGASAALRSNSHRRISEELLPRGSSQNITG